MSPRSVLLSLAIIGGLATAARAEPIYLKPGQCILVGSQQVCAMQVDQPEAQTMKTQLLYVCRYGMNAGSEVPDLKSYALFQINLQESGTKFETQLKNYGPSDKGKQACEAEADKRGKALSPR